MAELVPGTRLGQYEVTGRLGVGGMATVYRGYHAALDRTVAIKVLPAHSASDEEFMGRFSQEAKTVARLRHPNIMEVYDFGQADDGLFYIINEYMGGGTLAARLGPPVEAEALLDLVDQLAAGLDYAHTHGVLHRDIKPSNILFSEDGVAVIADFGLAKILEGSTDLTQSGVVVGTPEFMAPEQAMGNALDGRADVYSLGIILYRMLVGHQPFTGDTPLAVVLAHVQKPLPMPRSLNAFISPDVEGVLVKALEKDPNNRYATAGLMADAFRTAVTGVPSRRFASYGAGLTAQMGVTSPPSEVGAAAAAAGSGPVSRVLGTKPWPIVGGTAAAILLVALAVRAVFSPAGSEPAISGAAPLPTLAAPTAPDSVVVDQEDAPVEAASAPPDVIADAIPPVEEPEPVIVEVEPTAVPPPIAAPPAPAPAARPTQTPRPAPPPPPPVAAPPAREPTVPAAVAPQRPPAQAGPSSGDLVAPMGDSGSGVSAPQPVVAQPAAAPPARPPSNGDVPVLQMGASVPTPAP